jgi:hypothetical protein
MNRCSRQPSCQHTHRFSSSLLLFFFFTHRLATNWNTNQPAVHETISIMFVAALSHICRYKILIDGKQMGAGLLAAADFSPPLQPPAELPDPEHLKPEDWVEEAE